MIEQLNWDSDFFGYPVGKFNHHSNGPLPFLNDESADRFRLIYVFSDDPLVIDDSRISEVDIKTTLVRDLGKENDFPLHPSISDYKGGKDDELNRLAIESGVYSRFRRDPRFKNNEFVRLYSKWISDSIQMKIADKLLVFEEDDQLRGFVSIRYKNESAEIGLIAVHGNSRGRGIAMALLNAAFFHSRQQDFPFIRIVTQQDNIPAMKLYLKAGFRLEHKVYIYHFWNI